MATVLPLASDARVTVGMAERTNVLLTTPTQPQALQADPHELVGRRCARRAPCPSWRAPHTELNGSHIEHVRAARPPPPSFQRSDKDPRVVVPRWRAVEAPQPPNEMKGRPSSPSSSPK